VAQLATNEIAKTILQLAACRCWCCSMAFRRGGIRPGQDRDTQLETLVSKGNQRAKVARGIVRISTRRSSATQLGITPGQPGLGLGGQTGLCRPVVAPP